jgi:very-short-patch-repair endonuclease
MKKLEFLEKARNTHGYKYNYLNLSDKVTLNDRIEIEYNGEVYSQSISKHLMGRCPEKAIKRKTTEDFILESKQIWNDKYDYSLTEYTGALNNIKIIYNGVVYEQRASSHLLGLAPEFRSNEESLLRDKVNQSDKEGIDDIKEFLEKYQIEYELDKNLDNNIFQFYLPNKRTVIEYLSKEHYLIKELDKNKEDYCEDNYIDLIRINYNQFDDIYRILWENLKNVVVLNNKSN